MGMNRMSLDPDFSPDEQEEKARLISQVLELQNTLDDLTHRVDKVKEENLKLKSENGVLGQYIENLMQASHVFQAVSPKSRRRHRAGPGSTMGSVIKCTAKAVRSGWWTGDEVSGKIRNDNILQSYASPPTFPLSNLKHKSPDF